VRDLRAVQPGNFGPQRPQQGVGDKLRRHPVEGTAIHAVHRQQGRPVGGLDHLADGRHSHASALGHHRDERLVLDGLDERGSRPGVTDVPQPQQPVGPVQQVGVAVVRAEDLDEHLRAVVGDRDERPRALCFHGGRGDMADPQTCRTKCRRNLVWSDAPVRHAEQDEHASPHGYPGGERQDHFQG
jgi:hypothetical protein